MSLSLAARRTRLVAVRTLIDASGGGALQYHDGDMPESPDQPAPNAPIAVITLASVSFELHPTEAVMTLVHAVGFAVRAGTPSWVRYVDGAGAAVYDCTAGAAGSGAQVVVANVQEPQSAQLWIGGEITATHTLTEL